MSKCLHAHDSSLHFGKVTFAVKLGVIRAQEQLGVRIPFRSVDRPVKPLGSSNVQQKNALLGCKFRLLAELALWSISAVPRLVLSEGWQVEEQALGIGKFFGNGCIRE